MHGPGVDEPLVHYEGAGTTDRRYLIADERGSVVATNGASVSVNSYDEYGRNGDTHEFQLNSRPTTDRRYLIADERGSIVAVNGASTTINAYDEYGTPASSNAGRFQYTGQMWLGEAQLYHYKARAYLPQLGRFAQTDPIGFAGGMNLYAYVGNDPVNAIDPWGLEECETVTGSRIPQCGAALYTELAFLSLGATRTTGGGRPRRQLVCRPSTNNNGVISSNCSWSASPIQLGVEYFLGIGPDTRIFDDADQVTREISSAPGIEGARRALCDKYDGQIPEGGYLTNYGDIFGLDDLLTADTLTEQYVGSYSVGAAVTGGRLYFTVSNRSSFTSLAYGSLFPEGLKPPNWSRSQFAPLGNTQQFFTWSERVPTC